MKSSTPHTSNRIGLVLAALAALALTACETTGSGPAPEAAKPPEPPMTHARAATQCWMSIEKGSSGKDIDKRADVVTKCIDDKMKAAKTAPAT
jgi:hypothetical protein